MIGTKQKMTSLTLETVPSGDLPATEPRWQDDWPAVAYDINYDHENNPQLDPQSLQDIMVDMGAIADQISGLTFVVNNPARFNPLTGGEADGAIGRLTHNNDKIGVLIRPQAEERKTTATILHEVTHYLDEMNGKSPGISEKSRKRLGAAVAVGLFSLKTLVEYKSHVYGGLDARSITAGLGTMAGMTSGVTTAKYIGYRLGSWERRAFRAQRNESLLDAHGSTLYSRV